MTTRGKKGERGATMVDYALIVAVVALIIGGVFVLQQGLGVAFKSQTCNESHGFVHKPGDGCD